jgi:hypothetical protein
VKSLHVLRRFVECGGGWNGSTEESGISCIIGSFIGFLESPLALLSKSSCERLTVGWHWEFSFSRNYWSSVNCHLESLTKMNSVGIYYPIGKGENRLRKSHSFGMFLIKKKSAKLLWQISSPHSTCEEDVTGTIVFFTCSSLYKLKKVLCMFTDAAEALHLGVPPHNSVNSIENHETEVLYCNERAYFFLL